MSDCLHPKTHTITDPHPYGDIIEVCDTCRMSRSLWEQGESPWTTIPLCDRCDVPVEQDEGICDRCLAIAPPN